MVENKIPLFIIEFLQRDEIFFVLKPQELIKLSKYLEIGEYKESKILNEINEINETKEEKEIKRKKISSSNKARKKFYEDLEKERELKNEKYRKRKNWK